MKQCILSILSILVVSNTLFAQNTKEIKLSFDGKDFSIQYKKNSEGFISCTNIDYTYDEDCTLPCIPYTMVNVAIPSSMKFCSLETSETKKLYKDNIILSSNPRVLPTNRVSENIQDIPTQYKEGTYPNRRVEYISSNNMGTYTLLTFKLSPFEYDSRSRKLFFSETIALKLSLSASEAKSMEHKKPLISNGRIKSMVINPDDIIAPPEPDSLEINPPAIGSMRVDYLIITNSELKPYFAPLVEWKKTKGVRTEVITTEYIDSHYQDSTMQLKIKQCLYEYYMFHDLQYVLLGGDNTIVDAQGCYGKVIADDATRYIDLLPTDQFYACFEGRFDWNLDGDDSTGEVGDGVVLIPSIYVTRAPVRRPNDVIAFVNKTLAYEKSPTLYGWNNNFLMCGRRIDHNETSEHSDAEQKGRFLLDLGMLTNWTGSFNLLYDTFTDIPDIVPYRFTTQHLQEQIRNGYCFIDVMTHGVYPNTSWVTEGGTYTPSHAARSDGQHPTIITTMACFTNAFDFDAEPCLSEAFIRNPNNGVVAYLGSSREGWTHEGNGLGASLNYELYFYRFLFDNIHQKNFGKIVADAKMAYRSHSSNDGTYRWLQYGINPIGDAEMPIYTSTPTYFTNVAITDDGNNITVNTGLPGCRICVMSIDDMGATYYEVRENVQSAVFNNVNTRVSICVTKQNYIPYISNSGETYIQNETITGTRTIADEAVIVGSHVTSSKAYGPVNFQGGNVTIRGNEIRLEDGTTINANSNVTITNNQ